MIQTCFKGSYSIFLTAAQIKTLVSQLGTSQDTSELQDRLYVEQMLQLTKHRLVTSF